MMNRKFASSFLGFAIVIFLGITACLPFSKQSTEENQAQISALQTQNALLQAQIEQQNNAPEIPDVPTDTPADEEMIPVPVEESIPTSPVPAGKPINYDGWAITVSKEIVIDYNAFGVTFIVRNLGESDRVFRYQLASVMITDDQGNTYQPTDDYLCEEHMYITKNLSINGDDSENIYTPQGFRNCHDDNGLQQFSGPIAINAQQLFVHLENFGPLNGVTYVIDL